MHLFLRRQAEDETPKLNLFSHCESIQQMFITNLKYLCLFSVLVCKHEHLEQTNRTDALMYMQPPTSCFLPMTQLLTDKRNKLSVYYLISDKNDHTTEG